MGESVPDFIAGWFAGNKNLVMHVQSYISHHLSTCVTINHLDVIQFSCWYTGCAGVIAGQPADTVKVLILTTLSSLLMMVCFIFTFCIIFLQARLQTQGTGVVSMRYKSMTHCFADITKTEGVN